MARHLARVRSLTLAVFIAIFLALAFPIPAEAQGIAISGNFYRQHFELIPGQRVSTPDICVVVFNNGEDDLNVKLVPQTPLGVELLLPATDFTLSPGEERQIEVGVAAGLQVAPGEYNLVLSAEAYREGEGIKLVGAAQQQAGLTVIAEYGEVEITTVSPEGEPFPTKIHLYKIVEGQRLPCGYAGTGNLSTKLTPGEYVVEAHYQGSKVVEESFSLAAGEKKTIRLVPQTVFIEGFAVVPNYYSETGELAFARIVYTINNMYQPVKDVTAILKVSLGDRLVDKIELLTLPTLDVGKTGGSGYNYIPTQGWQEGTYRFSIELYSQGKLYAQSTEVEMLSETMGVGAPVNWLLIGGIIAAVVIVYLVVVRRRRA